MTLQLTVNGTIAPGIDVGAFVPFDTSAGVSVDANAGPFQSGTVIIPGTLRGEVLTGSIDGTLRGIIRPGSASRSARC